MAAPSVDEVHVRRSQIGRMPADVLGVTRAHPDMLGQFVPRVGGERGSELPCGACRKSAADGT